MGINYLTDTDEARTANFSYKCGSGGFWWVSFRSIRLSA